MNARAKKEKKKTADKDNKKDGLITVYVVSGSSGASALQIVETVLAQFPKIQVSLVRKTHVRNEKQLKDIVAKASKTGGIIVHSLVNDARRKVLIDYGKKQGVSTIDVTGTLQNRLEEISGHKPLGKPGLYYKQHHEYFDRIAAIEFAINHDDGQKEEDLQSADVVLIGVSRSGKTPLSMYLAVQGWKAANVPLVVEVPPPPVLYKMDRRRVIGLSIAYEQLFLHRSRRYERMGVEGPSIYTDRLSIIQELENARKVFRKGRFHVIDVTDKPIETTAREVIEYLTVSFKGKPHKKTR
ncbi:MAG: pyruvate, water dikinase regulatory protein [Nitrospirota bacterium]